MGLDKILEAQGEQGQTVRTLLQSENTAEFVLGMQALQYYIYDGGHTWVNITRYCPKSILPGVNQRIEKVRAAYPVAARLADEGARMTQEKFTIEKEMNALREQVLGKGRYFKKGNTCSVWFTDSRTSTGKAGETTIPADRSPHWRRLPMTRC